MKARNVFKVLPHGEVVVERRLIRDVADIGTRRQGPCFVAVDADLP